MSSVNDLARLLGIDEDILLFLARQPKYREFNIPKKNGGYRSVQAPFSHTKVLQKRLLPYLNAVAYRYKTEIAYGYLISVNDGTPPRNIVSNANRHLGKRHILSIDLKDHFNSISDVAVKNRFLLSPFNFNNKLALLLTMLVTCKGYIPTGSPTSPPLSNLLMEDLDKRLLEYAKSEGLRVTRYVDDLTFSSESFIDAGIVDGISMLIEDCGFKLNPGKTRFTSHKNKLSVTGVTINKKPNIDRKRLRELRCLIYDIEKNGIASAAKRHFRCKVDLNDEEMLHFQNSLRGSVDQVGFVRGREDRLYTWMYTTMRNCTYK